MKQEMAGADRAQLRRATERLLAWGFTPKEIAGQLHCSQSWVYSVRRQRQESHADMEELGGDLLRLVHIADG